MKVKTFFYEYDVRFVSKASEEWQNPPPNVEDDDSGYTDHDHELIVIRSDLSPAMQADCLLHEVLHVAVCAGGANGATDKTGTEEDWVCQATAGLKQMLVLDNDELWEYLGVEL